MRHRTLLAAAWTALVLTLCLLPASWLPRRETNPEISTVPHTDKVVHFGLFAVFGALWMRVGTNPVEIRAARVLAGGLALAVLTEAGQSVPAIARDSDWFDLAADLAGVVIAIGIWRLTLFAARSPASSPR